MNRILCSTRLYAPGNLCYFFLFFLFSFPERNSSLRIPLSCSNHDWHYLGLRPSCNSRPFLIIYNLPFLCSSVRCFNSLIPYLPPSRFSISSYELLIMIKKSKYKTWGNSIWYPRGRKCTQWRINLKGFNFVPADVVGPPDSREVPGLSRLKLI